MQTEGGFSFVSSVDFVLFCFVFFIVAWLLYTLVESLTLTLIEGGPKQTAEDLVLEFSCLVHFVLFTKKAC